MALEQVAQAHYRRSQAHAARVVAAALAVWREVGPAGWQTEVRRVAGLLAAGQLVAAVQAAEYLVAVAQEQDMAPAGATLVPRALAGVAANGRDLTDILSIPAQRATALLEGGATAADAATSGAATLTRIVGNEVVQAGTTGTQIAMTGQERVTGYIRMLQAPACGRCVILAGAWYEWNAGFKRHPGCDCIHVPAADSFGVSDLRTNPREYFNSLPPGQQDRVFGNKANADAVREGADIGRVVNAQSFRYRGRTTSGLYEFAVGDGRTLQATRRGTLTQPGGRLTPKSIYQLADGDRAEAVRLLTDNGYLR